MKVNFPNRLGHASTSPEQVDLLSSQFGFSAAYSDFLKNQNGFNFSDLESISETAEILTGDPESSEGKSDLRVLYSIGTEDPYYDLEIKISDPFATFGGAFFPIGEGYGGNVFCRSATWRKERVYRKFGSRTLCLVQRFRGISRRV